MDWRQDNNSGPYIFAVQGFFALAFPVVLSPAAYGHRYASPLFHLAECLRFYPG